MRRVFLWCTRLARAFRAGISSAVLRIRTSPSALVLSSCVGFILAIVLHATDERQWLQPGEWGAWGGCAAAVAVLLSPRSWRVVTCLVVSFALGVIRYDAALAPLPRVVWPEDATLIEGVLDGPPDWREKGSRFVLREATWKEGNAAAVAPMGLVVTSSALRPDFLPGDRIRVYCKPRPLDPATKPAVASRVLLKRIGAECRSAQDPERVAAGPASLARTLGAMKLATRRRVARLFVEPRASFMLGLLSGDDAGLPYSVTQQFRATGTSHIIAVSGYNVNKIAGALLVALAALLLPRRAASLAAIAIIAAFVVFTGASASVVRAGLMSGIVLLARSLGRPSSQPRAFVYAATLMLVANPLALAHDLGFALSFAAVGGLMVFSAHTGRLLRFLPEHLNLRGSAAETAAATVGTAPLSLQAFGVLPLFAIPVNVLVLPAVPLSMGLGFLALVADAVWHPLAVPFAFAADLAMRWMLAVTAFGQAHLYHAAHADFGVAGMVVTYAALVSAAAWATRRWPPTDP
jgi:competence protein ComEC